MSLTKKLLMAFAICTLSYGRGYQVEPEVVEVSGLEITFEEMETRQIGLDYLIHLTVRNNSDSILVFSADNIEVVDKESGITFYSITRTRTVVPTGYLTDLITTVEIKPGRGISGRIWVGTPQGDANGDTKDIYYNDELIATME